MWVQGWGTVWSSAPAIIEPPVLALSEEVGPLVAPLQRPVNVPRQAPLGDALGVLVTADMRLPDTANTSMSINMSVPMLRTWWGQTSSTDYP